MKKDNIYKISGPCFYFSWFFFGSLNSCEVKRVEFVPILSKPSFSLEDIDKKFSYVNSELRDIKKKLLDIDDRLKICEPQLRELDSKQIDKEELGNIQNSINDLVNRLDELKNFQGNNKGHNEDEKGGDTGGHSKGEKNQRDLEVEIDNLKAQLKTAKERLISLVNFYNKGKNLFTE